MHAIDRAMFHTCENLGWLFCELAFRTGCRGPFAWSYRVGCWLYGKSTDPGIRSGELVPNPNFGAEDEPQYRRR